MAQPSAEELDIGVILRALGDPIRLQIVLALAENHEASCTSFDLPVAKSTVSHHLQTLRDAGIIRTRLMGTQRINELRLDDLEARFPGFLASILAAPGPAERTYTRGSANTS